ncbi:MAG: hypothetical protein KDD82_03645, partial [Planctomycetes bacterium]|nr:hypothetical protein [Planctomycetota bacterium]
LLALAEFARCPGSRRRRMRAVLGVVVGAAVVHGAARAWRRLRGQGPQPGDLRRRAQLRRGARLVRPYLLYGATLGAYFLARHAALEELVARADARTLGEAGFLSRVLVATLIYLDSWLSLVLPHGTSAHYPFGGVYLEPWAAALDPVPGRLAHEPAWGSALSFAPLAIHALLLGGGACLLAQRRPWGRAIGLGVWGFYLALGPVSHVLIPIGVLRADRLLYTPSAWACVALVAGPAAALARTRRRAALRLTYCALAGLCAWVCCAPLQRNLEAWSNNHLLWYRSHERYPEQPRIQLALGKEYLRARGSYMSREDRLASAEFLFRAAVAASPPGTSLAAKARAALGGLLLERGGVAEATGLFLQASQLDPRSVEASEGLARAFLTEANRAQDPQRRLGWLLRAEKIARQATRFAPRSYALWLTYGTVLSALDGREPDALLAYDHAVTLRANPWEGRFNRARLRAFMGDAPGALADYRAVAEQGLAPRTPVDPRLLEEALNQVARLGEATGDAEAQAWVRRARPALPAVTPR